MERQIENLQIQQRNITVTFSDTFAKRA